MRFFLLLFLAALPLSSLSATSDPTMQLRQAEARLTQHPDDAQALFRAAYALQQMQHFDQAERYWKRLITLRPQWPEPRNNLAIIHLKKGDYDGAIDLLISSLKTHPAYETAWRNLSSLYKGLASEAYRRALSEDQNTRSVLDRIQLQALDRVTPPPATVARADSPSEPAVITRSPRPVAAPAAAPPPARETPSPGADDEAIRQAVLQWANAWTRKDLNAYIAAYAPDYRGGRSSHRAWVDWRRQRILRPGKIQVSISRLDIRPSAADRARADFIQDYRSPNYRDRVVKRLDLTKIDGRWKITREKTLRVLQAP